MSIVPRTDASTTLKAYHKLEAPITACIDCCGKNDDGENLYRIVDKACCPKFRSFKTSPTDDHEIVLNRLVEDFKILFNNEFPTLLSSYPHGFIDFLEHSGLQERAIEVLRLHGAKDLS